MLATPAILARATNRFEVVVEARVRETSAATGVLPECDVDTDARLGVRDSLLAGGIARVEQLRLKSAACS